MTARSIVGPSAEALTTLRTAKRSDYYRTVAKLGLQAAEALEYAHQLGVVHRDIKPANLLLDARGNLWITDFGLAQFYAESELTRTGDMLGTLRYMSPEQAAGRAVVLDQRTDVYSLAVTLYELLTLERALPGESRGELLHQIGSVDPKPPRSIEKNIPPELETVLMKAASKEPADRYASAGAMADDLRRFLHDEPIHARPPSLWDKSVKWTRRHKAVAVSAVVVLVFALVGLTTSTILIARAQAVTKTALNSERDRATEANTQRALADRRYTQAREAVDFFTKVAAEELEGNAGAVEVRREMLEASLGFYQGLLDQAGSEDSSRSAELAAAQKKATEIFTELSAFLRFVHALAPERLLWESTVRDQLAISGDELSAAREAVSQSFNAGLPEKLRPEDRRDYIGRLTPEQKRALYNRQADAALAGFDAALTAEKAERLRQINRQVMGPLAFSDPEVVARLGLNAAQRETVKLVQAQYREAIGRWFESLKGRGNGGDGRPGEGPPPDGPRGDGQWKGPLGGQSAGQSNGDGKRREGGPFGDVDWDARVADAIALRRSAVDRIVGALTLEQAAAWKTLTGKPFDGNVWQPPFGGGGPGRFGRGPGGPGGGGPGGPGGGGPGGRGGDRGGGRSGSDRRGERKDGGAAPAESTPRT